MAGRHHFEGALKIAGQNHFVVSYKDRMVHRVIPGHFVAADKVIPEQSIDTDKLVLTSNFVGAVKIALALLSRIPHNPGLSR